MNQAILKTLNTIAQAIYDKKGFNILSLDVRGVSNMADYVVIAEGNIDRHLRALAYTIKDSLSQSGQDPFYVEGEQGGDWIVIDYGDIVVHLMVPDFRVKYELEALWKKAKIVDLVIEVRKTNEEGWE